MNERTPSDQLRVCDWFTPARFSLLLALALATAFYPVILGSETFVYRDFGVLAYPTIYHHHQSFWRGELPLWNPLSNCGVPFLAQWGTMTLYPFSVLYLLLPLPWSANIFCLAHLFWAGLGMYYLSTQWQGNRFASAVAGFAFVFNGVTLSSLIWPNYTVALGWMPWVVLLVERAWSRDLRATALATVVASLQMLSGVPEMAVLTWLLLLAIGMAGLVRKQFSARILIQRSLIITILAAGLMAIQLLPFLELLSHSQRSSGFAATKWAWPGWAWANLLVPLFHCYLTPQGVFFQYGQEFMSSTYLGIIPLLLSISAVLHRRIPRAGSLAALTVLSCLMALGDNGFLYPMIKAVFPWISLSRYPVKYLFLASFAVPLLASFALGRLTSCEATETKPLYSRFLILSLAAGIAIAGILWVARTRPMPLDQWTATWHSGAGRLVILFAVAVLLGGLKSRGKPAFERLLAITFLTLMILDVRTHAPNQNPSVSSSVMAPGLWELHNKTPAPKPGENRVFITPRAEDIFLKSSVADLGNDFLGKRLALWSNLNLLDGIPKLNGSATLQIREQAEIQSLLYSLSKPELPRLLDMMAVSKETAPGDVIDWNSRDTFLPMISLGQNPVFADRNQTLNALTNALFEPQEMVYLPPEAKPFIKATNQSKGRILSYQVSAHQIDLEVETPAPTMLVIAQSFYPAWHAYVDSTSVPLWRANHAFQACEIPPGRHTVRFSYEDRMFRYGLAISMVSLVVCSVMFLSRRRSPAQS